MSTTRKPLLILTPMHESHIQSAITCAKTQSLQMKIRSGGHDYEGISYWSEVPFFILDMFNLRSIKVNIEDETAWVQAGATVGEMLYKIAEKSNTHGFPVGVCPTMGVGGHLSGGGYGYLMRKYGLSVDNIVDAQLIDVNGRVLNRETMGKDLFWAITGGGASSFGVVLAYKIKLVRVPAKVTVFDVQRTLEQNATEIVYRYQHVAHKLPKEIFIRLTVMVMNITGGNKKTINASFMSLFLGDSERLVSLMNKRFPELGLKKKDCKEMSFVQSYIKWTNYALGTNYDIGEPKVLLNRAYNSTHHKRKSDYWKEPIPKDGLEYIWKRMISLEKPMLTFNPYGGKMAKISPSAKPFPHRAGIICKIQYATNWKENGVKESEHYVNLTRMLHTYMTPFVSKSPRDAYFNYRDLDLGINHNGHDSYLEGAAYGVKYFKHNFKRLVHIKTKVDPDNFFRNEQSIPTLPS
ncbi:hypothetical protein ACSBR1_015491 [Camellia fascicularis]